VGVVIDEECSILGKQVEKEKDDMRKELMLLKDAAACCGTAGSDQELQGAGGQGALEPAEVQRERVASAHGQIEMLLKEKSSLQGVVELMEKELAREKREREEERQALEMQRRQELTAKERGASIACAATENESAENLTARDLGKLGRNSGNSSSQQVGQEGAQNGKDLHEGNIIQNEETMQRDLVLLRREMEHVRGEVLEKERHLQRYVCVSLCMCMHSLTS